jgi:hypothetical protein
MPTLLRIGPYRFFVYSGDRIEPQHIHVERDDSHAKFWLGPVRLHSSHGFGRQEIKRLHKMVEDNQSELKEGWHEYLND